MKVLIAPDKFKGSLDAKNVCAAVEAAFIEAKRNVEIIKIAMADGGEGTCDMLTEFSSGKKIKVTVLDPFFRPIEGAYGISGDGKTAFVEMATASGLQLLKPEERNPMIGTTYGTGQLIASALDQGVTSVILGVGGSATNDGGMGMGEALGAQFYDDRGYKLKPVGENLVAVKSLSLINLHPRLQHVTFTAICDVNNPFSGENGAARVFGPQKGATTKMVERLDDGLKNFAAVVKEQTGIDINFPGAGAGGGLGGGAKIFLNINFQSGIKFLIDFVGLESLIRESDLVITGEGKMDQQTLSGKVVKGIADLSKIHDKPLVAIVGKNELTNSEISAMGHNKVVTLINGNTTEQHALENTFALVKKRVSEDIIPFFL